MVTYVPDSNEQTNEAAMDLALARFGQLDAIEVTQTDEGFSANISDLVVPAILSMSWLAHQLAEASGSSLEDVAAALREFIDG